MGEKKFHSAKRKRMINNTIVHIVLAVLAAIWIFPIIWVVLTGFRAEKRFLCIHLLPTVLYTG